MTKLTIPDLPRHNPKPDFYNSPARNVTRHDDDNLFKSNNPFRNVSPTLSFHHPSFVSGEYSPTTSDCRGNSVGRANRRLTMNPAEDTTDSDNGSDTHNAHNGIPKQIYYGSEDHFEMGPNVTTSDTNAAANYPKQVHYDSEGRIMNADSTNVANANCNVTNCNVANNSVTYTNADTYTNDDADIYNRLMWMLAKKDRRSEAGHSFISRSTNTTEVTEPKTTVTEYVLDDKHKIIKKEIVSLCRLVETSFTIQDIDDIPEDNEA